LSITQHREDFALDPETNLGSGRPTWVRKGLYFVPAQIHPMVEALLIVGNELSGTTSDLTR